LSITSAQIHHCFLQPARDPLCADRLISLRRQRLLQLDALMQHETERRVRAFPVLAILAPAVTDAGMEIEYPGDPMCLYAALSVAVSSAMAAAQAPPGLTSEYGDLFPDWGDALSAEYRQSPAGIGARSPLSDHDDNPDQMIFDPRAWDNKARRSLQYILQKRRPRVVMISTVSPAHRYALQIARLIKRNDPTCLVVFGGRHMDETMRYDQAKGVLRLSPSSTITVMSDGRAPQVVDFMVSGEGYFALDLLLRAIALSMDLAEKTASTTDVVATMSLLSAGSPVSGKAVITAYDRGSADVFPINGPACDVLALPSPYRAFSVRARFPIFADPAGHVMRTAHILLSNACPYHCSFCSESAQVVGILRNPRSDQADAAVARICEYVSYGAEAVFFDDSIFWAGHLPSIREFTGALQDARNGNLSGASAGWIAAGPALQRLRNLQWGAQVTADLLTKHQSEDLTVETLHMMRSAGCSYLYLGIESMADAVMAGVHKNQLGKQAKLWKVKVRTALERVREAGIRAGSSILFGLDNETPETIAETIEEIGKLIDDGLLMLASPNIMTYHPATAITRAHRMEDKIDYHSADIVSRPPYAYFEEAFPGVVSRYLTEQDIWQIHNASRARWKQFRNDEPLSRQLSELRGYGER
jgi:radical SAM superfamily enzyme YgiQ (UPF0313 family)